MYIMKTKFKIFTGMPGLVSAAEEANAWIEDHPYIDDIEFQFNNERDICIMYKEMICTDNVRHEN